MLNNILLLLIYEKQNPERKDMSFLKPAQVQKLLLDMDNVIEGDLPDKMFGSNSYGINYVGDICTASLGILFLCLMIKFVIDCLGGYDFNILKKYLFRMMILGVIISPVFYPILAKIYINFFHTMMEYIGNNKLEEIREAMFKLFHDGFKDGEAGMKKLFGFLPIKTTPLPTYLAMLIYLLFIISMYEILAIPVLLCCITIALVPIMLAFSPFFEDMKEKMAMMLFGTGVVYPAVLFGLSTFLPISITIAVDLLMKENMILLTVITLAYSLVIAYSLPVIGYISGMSFLSELRVIFPVTWLEYIIFKPIGFAIAQAREKPQGKKGGK
jgi:hypothetical protein